MIRTGAALVLVLAVGLLLAGCAAPGCPTPAPVIHTRLEYEPPPPSAGARLSTGSDLPAAYKATLGDQKSVVMNPASSQALVAQIVGADKIARAAMAPWRTRHPHPTYEQVKTARDAIEALRLALAQAFAEGK